MKRFFYAALMTASMFCFAVPNSNADLVAYWNFNDQGLPGGGFGFLADPDDFPLQADQGAGVITVGGGIFNETIINASGDTIYRWIPSFVGTSVNALGDDSAGGALSLQGGTDTSNNGGYIQFAFDMTGLMDLAVSYASRGTSTGFSTHTWSWSTDGGNFTDFDSVGDRTNTSFSIISLDSISFLNDASTAFLRVTVDGATTITGNNRFDNIQLNATAIPEPGSVMTLTLISGLLITMRRRV